MRLPDREPRQTKPLVPNAARKIFTEAERRYPTDFTKQAQLIVQAHRPAGLPENFQPLLMSDKDKGDRPDEVWEQFVTEYERPKQEAATRGTEKWRREVEARKRAVQR